MLIISKFHDFYDNVTSFGIDKTVVYNRTTSEVVISKEIKKYFEELLWDFREIKYSGTWLSWRPDDTRHDIFFNIIGFCGKIFPFFTIRQLKGEKEIKRDFYLEAEDILSFIEQNDLEKFIKKKYYWDKGRRLSKNDLEYFFSSLKGRKIKDEIFFEFKSPIFYYEGPFFGYRYDLREDKVKINPNLSEIYFYKFIDSFTAFQEIYMYLSGVLGVGQKETVEIKDKDMLIKKGFDSKSSFRHPVKFKDKEK